jgi:hypothetical protein
MAGAAGSDMIRGALEVVNREVVQGWLFCSAVSLRGTTVLAFVESRCVGAGKIDVFRRDLKEAGLGDGYAGFAIPITLSHSAEAKTVVVRLENSDLCLLQKDAAIRHSSAEAIVRQQMA